eukprot:4180266-Pyramimonas_sp.AAC.1
MMPHCHAGSRLARQALQCSHRPAGNLCLPGIGARHARRRLHNAVAKESERARGRSDRAKMRCACGLLPSCKARIVCSRAALKALCQPRRLARQGGGGRARP